MLERDMQTFRNLAALDNGVFTNAPEATTFALWTNLAQRVRAELPKVEAHYFVAYVEQVARNVR